MKPIIHGLHPRDQESLQQLTKHHLRILLETTPELSREGGVPQSVRKNFSFETLFSMFSMGVSLVDYHRFWVLEVEGRVVGHWIASIRTDFVGQDYGYLYSLGFDSEFRRRGWAQDFWELTEDWWMERELHYLLAETHVENLPIQRFLESRGFECRERKELHWPYFVWRKSLRE